MTARASPAWSLRFHASPSLYEGEERRSSFGQFDREWETVQSGDAFWE